MGSSHENGSSSEFRQARLLACDYDGTMFDTFEPSPTGIGVNEAYRLAIEQVFDFDRGALERYEEAGGHQNRTPTEIASSLAPNAKPTGVKRLTEQIVQAKLDVLLDQVGQELDDGALWPRPIPGFTDAWQRITEAKTAGEPLSTAVISAGHAEFIQKSFAIAGLELPDFMVTDETVRGLYSTLPLEKLTKPSVLPMDIIRSQWMGIYADTEEEMAALRQTGPNERVTYVGDDLKKDAQLAHNAGVDFVYVAGEAPEDAWKVVAQRLRLGSLAVRGAGQ